MVNRDTDQATSWKVRVVNARKGNIYFLQNVQTGPRIHTASFQWVPGFFPEVQRPRREVNHAIPLVRRMTRSGYTSLLPLYAVMVWAGTTSCFTLELDVQFTHQQMHFYSFKEHVKIYIKIHINIAPTCFGLRPSSGSLH